MKFDKSKVCVAGLHEVPAGTMGYYSDEICNLRDYVKDDDKDMCGTIIKEPQDGWYKLIDKDGDTNYYRFFYPCEEQVKPYRPCATIEEVMLKRLFTWYAVKKEEYETLQKDIMEGEKDKELWIATLKVDREKYKDEMERLKEIDNSSDYRIYDKQFNTELYKQTDKIIIELEKWQTYLNEGNAEI